MKRGSTFCVVLTTALCGVLVAGPAQGKGGKGRKKGAGGKVALNEGGTRAPGDLPPALGRAGRRAAPAVVVIAGCQKRQPAVHFPHQLHVAGNKIPCARCHHKGQAEKSCAAGGCHPGEQRGKVPGCNEMSIKKNPYHMLCRSCHKPHARTRATIKGPVRCKGCHAKPGRGVR